MLQELTADKSFGPQETCGAACVWGSPWEEQEHSKQFSQLHWSQDSGSLPESTVISAYLSACSPGRHIPARRLHGQLPTAPGGSLLLRHQIQRYSHADEVLLSASFDSQ